MYMKKDFCSKNSSRLINLNIFLNIKKFNFYFISNNLTCDVMSSCIIITFNGKIDYGHSCFQSANSNVSFFLFFFSLWNVISVKSSDRMSIVKLEKREMSGITKKHYRGIRFEPRRTCNIT